MNDSGHIKFVKIECIIKEHWPNVVSELLKLSHTFLTGSKIKDIHEEDVTTQESSNRFISNLLGFTNSCDQLEGVISITQLINTDKPLSVMMLDTWKLISVKAAETSAFNTLLRLWTDKNFHHELSDTQVFLIKHYCN
jgi:hypothetical protein